MLAEIKNTFPIQPDKRKIQTDQSRVKRTRRLVLLMKLMEHKEKENEMH